MPGWTSKPPRGSTIDTKHSLYNGMQVCLHFFGTGSQTLASNEEYIKAVSGPNLVRNGGGALVYDLHDDGGVVSGMTDANNWKLVDSGAICDPGGGPFTIQVDVDPLVADMTRVSNAGGTVVNRGFVNNWGWNVQTPNQDNVHGTIQIELENSAKTDYNIIQATTGPFDAANGGPFHRCTIACGGTGTTPQIYVDGAAVTTLCLKNSTGGTPGQVQYQVRTSSQDSIDQPLQWGSNASVSGANGWFFQGYISRFIYWNRLLTTAEVAMVGNLTDYSQAYAYMLFAIDQAQPFVSTSVRAQQGYQVL